MPTAHTGKFVRAAAVIAAVIMVLLSQATSAGAVTSQSNPNVRYTLYVTNAAIHEIRASYSWDCMDIRGNSTNPGAAVQRFDCNGHLNQRFYFISQGDGTFTINAYWQGYCVGAPWPAVNAPVTLNDCMFMNPLPTYRWVDRGSNHWEIVEARTGLCLQDNGRRVQLTLARCQQPLAEPYPSLWTAIYKGQYNYGAF